MWRQYVDQQTLRDAFATAKKLSIGKMRRIGYFTVSAKKFSAMKVSNHRASIEHKTAEEAYPIKNRPRGIEDINSVNYFLKSGRVSPIIVVRRGKKFIVLDGVHRLVAAFIKKKNVRFLLFEEVM